MAGSMANSISLVCFDLGGVVLRICQSWAEGCVVAGLEASRVNLHDHDPGRVQPDGGREQAFGAAHEETRADQEHQRKRHLGHDERPRQQPLAARRVAPCVVQRIGRRLFGSGQSTGCRFIASTRDRDPRSGVTPGNSSWSMKFSAATSPMISGDADIQALGLTETRRSHTREGRRAKIRSVT